MKRDQQSGAGVVESEAVLIGVVRWKCIIYETERVEIGGTIGELEMEAIFGKVDRNVSFMT